MIDSWRFLVVNGAPAAERDLVRMKATRGHRREIYEKLDKVVEKLKPDAQPFAQSSSVPGTNSFEVIASNRTAYRLFVRRLGNKLVVIGVGDGGTSKSTKSDARQEMLSRLAILKGKSPQLAEPATLPDETQMERTSRFADSRIKERDQSNANISAIVFKDRRPAPRAGQSRRPQRPKSTSELVNRRRTLMGQVELAEPAPGARLTGMHHEVQRAITVARADGRDLVSDWKRELASVSRELEARALNKSPLPKGAPLTERITAGVRLLLQAEAQGRAVEVPGL